MQKFFKKVQTKRFLSRLLLAVLVILFYKIIMNFSDAVVWVKSVVKVLAPFFYGFVIAYLLNIPCTAVEKHLKKIKYQFFQKKSRGISVLIIYALTIAVIVLIINKVIPTLQKSISDFIFHFNTYYNNAVAALRELPLENFGALEALTNSMLDRVAGKDLLNGIGLKEVMNSLSAVLGLTSHVISGFITIVASIYFLLEAHNFAIQMERLMRLYLSEKTKNTVIRYGNIVNDSFRKFIVCQLLDSLILCIITTVEFTMIGSKYSVALGVMLAVCNIVPYFGSIFGSIGAVLIIAGTSGISTGAIAAVVLFITQQIDGNVIQPKLMGSSFSLSPALIVIGITLGGAAAGIWGMVLAVPVVNILKIVSGDILTAREEYVKNEARNAGKLVSEPEKENQTECD